jgi:hypothetical protein
MEPTRPTLSPELRAAAALLAEHTAAAHAANGTLHREYEQPSSEKLSSSSSNYTKRATSDYWLQSISHTGLAPM